MASDESLNGSIRYEYPIFEAHSLSKGGKLPDFERGAHACWYYCICAHQNLQSADDGATLEGELDTVPALNNIARSIATQYGLADPGEFLKFMPVVLQECERIGRLWDPRIMAPWNEKFLHIMN